MLVKASKLYNKLLEIYTDQFNKLECNLKKKIVPTNNPKNLILETYGYELWFS